jgi:hypothetical protein
MVQPASHMSDARMPHRGRPERRPMRTRKSLDDGPPTAILGVSPRWLLVGFLVALVLPINFSLAGLQLTAYNSILIVFLIPAFFYFLRSDPRVVGLDVFMALNVLWLAVAIYHNHGSARLIFILNQSVTLFGAYFLGRVLVRGPADHLLLFRCMFWIMLVLLPIAFIEFAFSRSLVDLALGKRWTGGGAGGLRLGFRRVTSVFPHPILFGLFCSIMVANFFYVFYEKLSRRLSRTGLAIAMTFMSLSSGPNIAQLIQLILISWERVFRFATAKWHMLVLVGATVLGSLQLGFPGGIAGFVIETMAFNPQTGYGRLEILEWGGASVIAHPVFGIGLSDWEGPWWRPASVDNFWLLTAMRYGLPALVFMWMGIALHLVRIMARRGLAEAAANYRRGYVIATMGLFVALGAVHIWGAVSVFVMFYFGAGAWIYAGDAPEEAAPRRRRPAEPEPEAALPRRPARQRIGVKA